MIMNSDTPGWNTNILAQPLSKGRKFDMRSLAEQSAIDILDILDAFSHFTYEFTEGSSVMVEFQGMCILYSFHYITVTLCVVLGHLDTSRNHVSIFDCTTHSIPIQYIPPVLSDIEEEDGGNPIRKLYVIQYH